MAHRHETSTKGQREALAERVKALAERCGATAWTNDREREMTVGVHLGPYRMHTTFYGTRCDSYLAHWNVDLAAEEVTFPEHFVAGSVNPYHRQKATTVAGNFDLFLVLIERGLNDLRVAA